MAAPWGQGGGRVLEQWGSLQLAQHLLRVRGVLDVARYVIERSLLPDGRFEAHEFGRDQHSSASAGGLLIGLSGIRPLPDELIAPVAEKAVNIILPDGRVRGHDKRDDVGDTTWAESQILLGLSLRPHLVTAYGGRIGALARRLISVQHANCRPCSYATAADRVCPALRPGGPEGSE